jgi:hypothetical protein
LEIEPSTAEKYDIYLIRWGVTFRDLPIPEIAELSFRVEFPDECQAMELAPFRVATSEKTTISYGIPTITVRGVSVGDVFNKQIVYASLKPKIVAYGIQEAEFSWSLQGDAISLGSHVFFTAMGCSRGTTSVLIKQSVAAKTMDTLLVEGNWVSTELDFLNVELP